MAKKRKLTPEEQAAYDEHTRLIEARIAELTRQIETREREERKPKRR